MTKPANIRTPLGIPAALMLGAAVVAGAVFATGVRAQTAAPSEQPAAAAAQKFSEKDLQSYASAVVKVQDISVKWQDKLRNTKDPAATTEIQKKAEDEAVTAVKGEGLTVEKYNRIALATETDAELRSKVLDYVSKAK